MLRSNNHRGLWNGRGVLPLVKAGLLLLVVVVDVLPPRAACFHRLLHFPLAYQKLSSMLDTIRMRLGFGGKVHFDILRVLHFVPHRQGTGSGRGLTYMSCFLRTVTRKSELRTYPASTASAS